jgi:hypothetical protein
VRAQLWHRVVEMVFDATILGGIVATPMAGIVAIVSAFLPVLAPLRHLGGQIFAVVGLWFVLALLGAHLRMHRDEEHTAR